MRKSALDRPICWTLMVIGLVLPCVLRGSAWTGQDASLVVYVSSWAKEEDATFKALALELQTAAALHPQDPSTQLAHLILEFDDGTAQASASTRLILARARVIVAPTTLLALAVLPLAGATPIVFASHPDPVFWKLVTADSRQARPITGVTLAEQLHGKRMELLCEAFPGLKTLAILGDVQWDPTEGPELVKIAERQFGLRALVFSPANIGELDAIMSSREAAAFDAWYIPPTFMAYQAEAQIIAHLKRLDKPAIHSTVGEVAGGAVLAYEQDNAFAVPAMAELVRRILSGEDAASIPIERPRRYVLAVRAASKRGGRPVNPTIIRKADLVF